MIDLPDFDWHLAQDSQEAGVTDFEFALMRAFEGFGRWQAECLASVSATAATGPENALLHIIRMHERPKSLKEIALLMNRDDIPNLQYSLRKLLAAGLILRHGAGRNGVTYEATEEGRRVTDAFGALRRKLLIAGVMAQPDLAQDLIEATKAMTKITALYEESARLAATRRRP